MLEFFSALEPNVEEYKNSLAAPCAKMMMPDGPATERFPRWLYRQRPSTMW